MRISIVIPALNEEPVIEGRITQLLERGGGLLREVIVADGRSRDGTVDAARRAGATVVECSEAGRALQMNEGALRAGGEVLLFLHADTELPEGYAERIMATLNSGADAGCFRLRFDSKHPLLRLYAWFTRFDFDLFRFGDQSLFVRAGVFRKTGGFRVDHRVMEDQEMVRRLRRQGTFSVESDEVTTSARNYMKNGVVRLQLIFALILLLYYAGARQETLVHLYQNLIKQ
ncbi:MAG: TIGR04283 family arsenosugar biosynthesis glycosyltransferase [Balneolaceae bacterium]